jgi:hypothetical protein
LGTVAVNQQQAPNDFTADGASWKNLGTFTITGTTLVVQLTDAANGIVGADAIRVVSAPSGLASPPGMIGFAVASSAVADAAGNGYIAVPVGDTAALSRAVEALELASAGNHAVIPMNAAVMTKSIGISLDSERLGSKNFTPSFALSVPIAIDSPKTQASRNRKNLVVDDIAMNEIAQAWLERTRPKQQLAPRQRLIASLGGGV